VNDSVSFPVTTKVQSCYFFVRNDTVVLLMRVIISYKISVVSHGGSTVSSNNLA